MPKQHNAFALKDFDEKKIFQRTFFRRLKLPAAADRLILESLADLTQCQNSEEMELRMHRLREIYFALCAYDRLIYNHTLRLKDLFNVYRVSNNAAQERAAALLGRYQIYHDSIQSLMAEFGTLFEEGNAKIDAQKLKELQKEFGARLKAARLKKNLSRQDMAGVLDLTVNSYGGYETGRFNPPMTALIRIAETLNVSIDWLAGLIP